MFERFEVAARARPDLVAVSNEVDRATYAELLEWARGLVALLAPASHALVLLALPGGAKFTAVQLAALGARAMLAPIPDKSTEREAAVLLGLVAPDVVAVESLAAQADILRALREPATILSLANGDAGADVGPHRVVTWAEVMTGRAAPLRAARDHGLPAAVRMIQFTSGSTATPKGILLSNENLLANLDLNRDHLETFRDQPVFCPVPQFHAMGNAVVLEHLWYGSPTHLANRFLPGEDVARMTSAGCTAILASPSYFKLLIKLGILGSAKLPRLSSFTIGTAAIDPTLVRDLHRLYPHAVVHCRYGLSESVGALTRLDLRAGDEELAPGLVGPVAPEVVLGSGLVAPGEGDPVEIAVKSPCNGIGQLTARGVFQPLADEAGFLRTGDVGHLDRQGRIHLRGRMTAFLKVNGHRINPFELELALRSFPGVHEAVVVGPPDAVSGQRIVACLEAEPGHTLGDVAALGAFCRTELAPYKVPQRFFVYEKLPRTPAGKPDRARILKEMSS